MTLWVNSRRAGEGDTAAFELLWDRQHDGTYQTILRVLGPHSSLADEIFQDTWFEVIRAQTYRPGNFRAFLRTVATRKALDRLASASVRNSLPLEDPQDHPPRHPQQDGAAAWRAAVIEPARDAHAREATRLVLRMVSRMPTPQRVAWTMHYVEQLTFDEVAEAMGTPIGTAKTRVRLANAALAQFLDERGIDPGELESGS